MLILTSLQRIHAGENLEENESPTLYVGGGGSWQLSVQWTLSKYLKQISQEALMLGLGIRHLGLYPEKFVAQKEPAP